MRIRSPMTPRALRNAGLAVLLAAFIGLGLVLLALAQGTAPVAAVGIALLLPAALAAYALRGQPWGQALR